MLHRIESWVLNEKSTRVSTSFNVSGLLGDPILNSAVSETLRMQFRGLSVRGISQDTTLSIHGRPFELEEGGTVFLSMSCVHKDPGIYEFPNEFRLKRYVHMHTKTENDDGREKVFFWKNGAAIRHPLLPWGGGHFMVRAEFDIVNILYSALVVNLQLVKF